MIVTVGWGVGSAMSQVCQFARVCNGTNTQIEVIERVLVLYALYFINTIRRWAPAYHSHIGGGHDPSMRRWISRYWPLARLGHQASTRSEEWNYLEDRTTASKDFLIEMRSNLGEQGKPVLRSTEIINSVCELSLFGLTIRSSLDLRLARIVHGS